MKRQVEFEETDSAYCFKCGGVGESPITSFTVKKPGLEFDVKLFYEAFFKGEDRYESIEFPPIGESWSKEARYVFGVVKSIAEDVCAKIKAPTDDGVVEVTEESAE